MAYFLGNRVIGVAIWAVIAGCGERPGSAGKGLMDRPWKGVE